MILCSTYFIQKRDQQMFRKCVEIGILSVKLIQFFQMSENMIYCSLSARYQG